MSPLIALLLFIFVFLFLAVFFVVPVSYALGISSMVVFMAAGHNVVTVAQYAWSSLDSFSFLAIPFYIYAGTLMEYSGISKMLIQWIGSIIGRVRGNLGIITILASMAFGVLTGSAMATISAIGKIVQPEMDKENYPKAYVAALLAATCFLGILIPPSVPGIMYALSAGIKISEVWMVTIGPALIFGVGYIIVNYWRIGRRLPKPEKFDVSVKLRLADFGKNTIRAIPALLMPIIIYGCIYGGICTPTEAGALSAVYGILYYGILWIVKKKEIKVNFLTIAAISGASTAVIGLLNAFSVIAGKVITLTGVSGYLSQMITSSISTKGGFLLMINVLFLFLGTFMDINATILIMTPLLLPVATGSYGVLPIHFGAIMLVNMCVGFLTPPFAVGIFVGQKIAGASFTDTVKEAIPFILVGLIAILVTTLCPDYLMFFVNIFS